MTDQDDKKTPDKAKILSRVVCICKGIPLSKVLEGLEGSDTVADVNRKVGTGCGGCKGERCGPRIKTLLRKYKDQKQKD
ncbi:(2Fe-2S)-binding protein [Pseudobacteriovorax antillogorgiicola]|uniref:BFD-like [2Fe-2S] binding domain-containing protein n=1 Tax=Pseudobacteriovorax antillogorgiicola TaxID=1513793 RepID=A0A1Y6CB27_9BACT|nr:(2Fe-2S)-binding protein [Pseudobacteriovorax antillogorgiicola]TCS49451.1 BFD-like [2Fe-2S] binding protein [Pseudobacteriovorax antillogorgiicola]SMF46466.1 BFD-like [2Fe-2S] binding domain-containing protein [Pseudobacteriovorax antillogorgiicola]